MAPRFQPDPAAVAAAKAAVSDIQSKIAQLDSARAALVDALSPKLAALLQASRHLGPWRFDGSDKSLQIEHVRGTGGRNVDKEGNPIADRYVLVDFVPPPPVPPTM